MAHSASRVYDAFLELCRPWNLKFDLLHSREPEEHNLVSLLISSGFASDWGISISLLQRLDQPEKVDQLEKDLQFLRMFCALIREHSSSDADVWYSERNILLRKIEAVAHEIAEDLHCAVMEQMRECSTISRQKLLQLLADCRRKIIHLKAEMRKVTGYLRGCSKQVHLWYLDNDQSTFTESVVENLKSIMKDQKVSPLFYELLLMQDSIRLFLTSGHKSCDAIRVFLAHVESVTVRIANQSCKCSFNKTDSIEVNANKIAALMDLVQEIDPARNPYFLRLILKLLRSVNKIGRRFQEKNLDFFLESELFRFFIELIFRAPHINVHNEVYSLLALFVNSELEDSREDVQSLFEEINAAMVEMSFRMFKDYTGASSLSSELDMRICLLELELFLKEQAETGEFNRILKKLRYLTEHAHQEKKEHWRQILQVIEEMSGELESQSSQFNSKNINVVKNSKRLLFEIVFLKAEAFLAELLKSNFTSMACLKDQIESLLDEIKNFKRVVAIYLLSNTGNAQMIYIQIEAFARKITVPSTSFTSGNLEEEMFKKMLHSLPELFNKVKIIKAQLKEISPPFPISNFPKSYELGFFDFLVKNIGELLKYNPMSIAPVKHDIKEIQLHLESLASFLIKVSESGLELVELKDLVNHIMNVAYKVEYVIDSIEVDAHWQHFLWLNNLLEDIRLVYQKVSKIQEISFVAKVENFTQVSCKMTSQDTTPAVNEMVLDLGDEEQVIIDRLTRGSSQRDVVSIVGMPGIGKTTLAKRVYNHQSVMLHFHRRAWCTVSQVYQKRELLLGVLSGIHQLTDEEIPRMTNEDLESKLRRCLLKNKYLIVMDDVWDIAAWNCLNYSLPDDMNGSRILITSRLQDVALEIKPDRDPHFVRLFTDEESWKLLEKKIFQGDGCPKELLLVGKEIAQLCKGLPLAVVAIAGLLQKSEKRMDVWKKISERLSSGIINDPETRCREILELSYKHLPEYLKACFLYLGVFLEDRDIPVRKLTRFWIAEGFIPNTVSKSLEDVAEDYLMDLINRNLVMISKKRSNGMVKACCLHDLLHDFCQSKAKEENYLQLITRFDEPYASFPVSDYGIELEYDDLDPVTYEAYRLSIFLRRDHFVDTKPSGPNTHSLVFFACLDSEPKYPYDISFICHNFKLLRVLDLECINMGVSFPAEIELLLHLRYLAVCGYLRSLPPSITKLWKLETLVVKGLRGKVILPGTIWQMTRLRHLHLDKYVLFDLQDEEFESSLQLDNLLSFSSPIFSYGQDTEKILKKVPNVLELRCILLKSLDSSKECNQFPRLSFLTQMESLKIVYHRRVLDRSEFDFPFSLKKLTLSNFYLPWNHISVIGRLPNLEVLKLLSGMFDGEIWDMREEEFQQLKFLKLEALNIVEWNATCDQLPQLERLVLRNCKALEKVPNDLADIATLQRIEVHWCRETVEESAKEIGEATEDIKILINRS